MANKNQRRGGQHSQDQSLRGSKNQMGRGGETEQGSWGKQSAHRDSLGQPGANYGLSRDTGYDPRETNANEKWEPENSRGPRGYGHSNAHGGPLAHQDDSQRGGQSWQQFDERFGRSDSSGSNDSASSAPIGSAAQVNSGTTLKSK